MYGYDRNISKLSKMEVLSSFVLMSIFFSLNHGCVTACVALASSDLGSDLGAYSSGTLYLAYTLCALLGSTTIVHFTGVKYGLVSALLLYCAYIGSFIIARSVDGDAKWIAALTGSTIGGLAAGYLWTAQGPFMQAAAKLYASSIVVDDDGSDGPLSADAREKIAMKKSNSLLASIFGFTYLVCEALMKAAATFLPKQFNGGETMIYVVFTIVSVICSLAAICVKDLTVYLPQKSAAEKASQKETSLRALVLGKSAAAVRLVTSDPKMILLYPVQMGFGFAGTFIAYYANSVLISNCINDSNSTTNYTGYFAALIAVVAGICSPLFSFVTRKLGGRKMPVMILGISAFLVEMAIYAGYNVNESDLIRGDGLCRVGPLVALYCLHGVGRGVWESTNKAVILDFFPDDAAAAFANVIVSSGMASTIGFFMYQFHKDLKDHPLVVTSLTATLCGLSLITYPLAVYIHKKK
eukprot:g3856.t1